VCEGAFAPRSCPVASLRQTPVFIDQRATDLEDRMSQMKYAIFAFDTDAAVFVHAQT
jgi:hypothetical protein